MNRQAQITRKTQETEITAAFSGLRQNSSVVKTDYAEMLSLTDKLRYDINFLAAMSADIVRAIEQNDHEIVAKLIGMENGSNR